MTGDQPVPDVIAMMFADGVHRDPSTGKLSILGTYSAIGATEFPATHPTMIVYTSLTDGRGETPLCLQLVDADEQHEPVFQAERMVDFADPIAVVDLLYAKKDVVFPEPGEYRLQLFSRGQFLRERRLAVELIRSP